MTPDLAVARIILAVPREMTAEQQLEGAEVPDDGRRGLRFEAKVTREPDELRPLLREVL